jgi:type VI secretion system protein ImpL
MAALARAVQGYEILLFIVLLLLSAALAWWLWVLLKRDRAAKAAEEDAKAEAEGAKPEPEVLVSPEVMRKAYRNGQAVYRNRVAGARNPYLVPWYLLVGDDASDKSALVRAVDTPRAPAEFPDPLTGRPVGCTWWYYDQAVVIDVDADAFARGEAPVPDAAWTALLDELSNGRPAQPVDGVVLAIPAPSLLDPITGLPTRLAERAAQLYAKLWQAQKVTGLSLPVWVVLTRCDELPGFGAFADLMPPQRRDDAFGWSSPYPLESAFRPEWVDEAVGALQDAVVAAGAEAIAGGARGDAMSESMRLPAELDRLRAPLATVLGTVFRRTAYQETLYLRGVWLVGRTGAGAAEAPLAAAVAGAGGRPVFARELLEAKVFAERDLPKPVPRWTQQLGRRQRGWQAAAAAAGVGSLYLLWQGWGTMAEMRANFVPALRTMVEPVRLSRTDLSALGPVGAATDAGAAQAIRSISRIDAEWAVPSFPVAWLDPLDARVRIALSVGHWRLMMADVRRRLERRARGLAAGEFQVSAAAAEGGSSELAAMRVYLGEALLLERFASVYNRLVESPDLSGLSELLRYTNGIELPPLYAALAFETGFAQVPASSALGGAVIDDAARPIDLPGLREELTVRLQRLSDAHFARLARNTGAVERLRTVAQEIDALAAAGPDGYVPPNALETIQLGLASAAVAFGQPEASWALGAGPDDFGGAAFQSLVRVAEDTRIFGREVRPRLVGSGRGILGRADLDPAALTSAIGPLAEPVAARSRIELTPEAEALRAQLAQLVQRPFMQVPGVGGEAEGLGRAAFLWDVRGLERAIALVEEYTIFVGRDLPRLPAPLRDGVLRVVDLRLGAAIGAALVRAQTPLPPPAARNRAESELRLHVQAMTSAYPLVLRLADTLQRAGNTAAAARVVEATATQSSALLERIDGLLREERAYLPPGAAMGAWARGEIPAAMLYDLQDAAELPVLMERQRQRIKVLATDLAEPLLDFLGRPDVLGTGLGPVAQRWLRIIEDIGRADEGRPGASVVQLERFVGVELAAADPANCLALAPAGTGFAGRDFFADRLIELRGGLRDACLAALDDRVLAAYDSIGGAFSAFLAGRYPFAESEQAFTGPYATPDEIAAFYATFDTLSGPLLQALALPGRDGPQTRAAVRFLEAMRDARPFFKAAVGLDGAPEAAVGIQARFRILPEREAGGRNIIDMSLRAGEGVTDNSARRQAIQWRLGEPVEAALRWAINAPVRPSGVAARGRVELRDRSAGISYDDPWALVTLLREHAPRPQDWRPGPGRQPHVVALSGTVTNADGSTAADPSFRVFVQVSLTGPPAADGTPSAERIVLPALPLDVPPLGGGTQEVAAPPTLRELPVPEARPSIALPRLPAPRPAVPARAGGPRPLR